METTLLQEPLGLMEAVLRVPVGDEMVAGYYLHIGGRLYSTRLAGTPTGPALWQLCELPAPAEEESAAAALLGREVRRVLLSNFPGDDTQPSLVLDLGQQHYLHFYPVCEVGLAPLMALSPDSGEVVAQLCHSVELPPVVTVEPSVRRRVLLGRRLLGAGVAVFFSSLISVGFGAPEFVAIPIALCGLVATLVGMQLLKRKSICPWCGEQAFEATGLSGYFCCYHCGNSIDVKLP